MLSSSDWSAVLVFFVKVVRFAKKSDAVGMDSFLSGLRFVFKRKIILGTISLDLFAVLLGGATALLPIFADDVLRTGPWGLGLLRAAPAVGGMGTLAVAVIWMFLFPMLRDLKTYEIDERSTAGKTVRP